MEALRALNRGMLPPVGAPIRRTPSTQPLPELLSCYKTHWLDSGTSALSAAVSQVLKRRPEIQCPRVIIPGYCCPDLVAAILYAGAVPMAVDIQLRAPGYNLESLVAALTSEVVAVIAVNFLGVSEQLDWLAECLAPKGVALIEDNAQWLPGESYATQSDFVVCSFGRGKPLSLLGGGGLCSRESLNIGCEPVALPWRSKLALAMKIGLYNQLLAPRWYGVVQRLPFLSLGQTAFSPLKHIEGMDDYRLSLFTANLSACRARKQPAAGLLRLGLADLNVHDLAAFAVDQGVQLLRYPLLMPDQNVRDRALTMLLSRGIGATTLYRTAITEVKGIDDKVMCLGGLPSARAFAGRLLTLPLHERVSEQHCQIMVQVLKEVLAGC